jgi:hypothetical protein
METPVRIPVGLWPSRSRAEAVSLRAMALGGIRSYARSQQRAASELLEVEIEAHRNERSPEESVLPAVPVPDRS